jgi:hypothetical protein
LSSEEERLFKKYYAFFSVPVRDSKLRTLSQLCADVGLIWIAVGLWQRMWWVAVVNAMFYLISGPVMWRLSPIAHYKAAAEKGLTYAVKDLKRFQHILDNRGSLGF